MFVKHSTFRICLKKKKELVLMFLSSTYTRPLLGPLVPLLGFMVISSLGFEARMGSALFAFAEM